MKLGAGYIVLKDYTAQRDGLLLVSGQLYPDHAEFVRSVYLAIVVDGKMIDVHNAQSNAGEHMPARLSRLIPVLEGMRITLCGQVLCAEIKPSLWQRIMRKKPEQPDGAPVLLGAPYGHFDFTYVG